MPFSCSGRVSGRSRTAMADDPGLAEARLELDRERHKLEMELRREELELRRTSEHRRGWRDPLVLAILAATIGLVGNGIVTVVNASTQRALEDQKDEAARILQSLSIADREQVKANLQFLVDTGLVERSAPKLIAYLQSQGLGEGPSIAAPNAPNAPTLLAVAEDDATPDATEIRKAFGPACAIETNGRFVNCGYQTVDACQAQLAKMPPQARIKQSCATRPAKVYCFAATSGTGLSLRSCTDTMEHCDGLRGNYHRMARTLSSLGKTCAPIDL